MSTIVISRFVIGSIFVAAQFGACNHGVNPQGASYEAIAGQLESDIDNAILKSDGSVWAWGSNSTGQIGDGTILPSDNPKCIVTLHNIVCLDLCEGAAFAADREGNVWFWGNRLLWEEPPGYDTTVTTPQKIAHLSGIRQLVVLGVYVYLLRNDGTLWRLRWDHNSPTQFLYPESVDEMGNIKMISGSLGLRDDGTIFEFPDEAWVGPEWGGIGSETVNHVSLVQNRPRTHTIVLKDDSTVWAWGRNSGGNLGNGTFTDNPIPSRIDTLKDIVAISASGARCLALGKDGTAWFWGLIHLDVEQGLELRQSTPIKIEGLGGVVMIHASAVWSMLFMKADGTYWSYDASSKEIRQLQL